tara:strand:+ start:29 stop:1150 length:1122 start_codon:yes stop_codon:yes gene_type:complete
MALVVGGNGVRTKLDKPAPFIVNGDMVVSQRSTSVTGVGDGDSGYHTIDRFKFEEGNTPAAVWTMTQESLSSGAAYEAGFLKALKMDCTTSDDLSNHGDILNVICYHSERQDAHYWKKGTSSAEKFTLAFWVKATKTGTHTCEIRDQANDRAVSASYTISSSDTWEKKVVNFPADTTGAVGTGNSKGLSIYWCLHHGGNYGSGSALQTAWGGSATNARYKGQVNNADSTSNNWHLTGVQLEVGEYDATTIPPFQHESYGDNLRRCERYYQHIVSGNHKIISNAHWASGSQVSFTINIPEMRDVPTINYDNGNDYWAIGNGGSTNTLDNLIIDGYSTNKNVGLYSGTGSGGTAGYAYYGFSDNASARLALVSEL